MRKSQFKPDERYNHALGMSILGMFCAVSYLDKREAQMGSRGEVPCQGYGDEIPIVPLIAKRNQTGIGEEPTGDNYDSDTLAKESL